VREKLLRSAHPFHGGISSRSSTFGAGLICFWEETGRASPLFISREDENVELNLTLTLPDALYNELLDGCREASCHPKIFAAEALQSVLASRRLPKVEMGRYGARMRGTSGGTGHEDETELVLTEHRILYEKE
jgi:hypothetical protein